MAPAAAPAPPGAEPADGAALALNGMEQGTVPRLSPNTDADRRAPAVGSLIYYSWCSCSAVSRHVW
jgi:hypothetical protein